MVLVAAGALSVENPLALCSLELAQQRGHTAVNDFFQHEEAAMLVSHRSMLWFRSFY
jgi:hypothetical protein